MLKFLAKIFSREKKKPNIGITAPLVTNSISSPSMKILKESTDVVTNDTSIVIKDTSSPSREMLKEATALKKEGKYEEACEKLKEAYSAKGSEDLTTKELLRLPMYLQLAKKNDEGWRILNDMNVRYLDVFSQAEIANQMRVFLEKDKKFNQALLFSVWSICKEVERNRWNMQESIKMADYPVKQISWKELAGPNCRLSKEQLDALDASVSNMGNEIVYGHTPKGNPITDPSYKMFVDRTEKSISIYGVRDQIFPLIKKLKLEDKLGSISLSISKYLRSSESYDLRNIRDIISSSLSGEKGET